MLGRFSDSVYIYSINHHISATVSELLIYNVSDRITLLIFSSSQFASCSLYCWTVAAVKCLPRVTIEPRALSHAENNKKSTK